MAKKRPLGKITRILDEENETVISTFLSGPPPETERKQEEAESLTDHKTRQKKHKIEKPMQKNNAYLKNSRPVFRKKDQKEPVVVLSMRIPASLKEEIEKISYWDRRSMVEITILALKEFINKKVDERGEEYEEIPESAFDSIR